MSGSQSVPPKTPTLADVLAALDGLGEFQEQNRAALEEIRSNVTTLSALVTDRLAQIAAGQDKTRADIMERLDRLQGRIDQLAQECFVNYAQGEAVRRHGDNTRAESSDLADQISGLLRQVRALRDRVDEIEDKGKPSP
jgi:predicted nuclease with TOPRIM domain